MQTSILKKRSRDEQLPSRPHKRPKRVKKQREYHSSSEDEAEDPTDFKPVNLADSEDEELTDDDSKPTIANGPDGIMADKPQDAGTEPQSDDEADSDDASDGSLSETSGTGRRKLKKRNDPDAFATSISKILGSKLSTSKRADPVLSRSISASNANQSQTDAKLEEKARRKIREEKRVANEKGRIRDVLGTEQVDDDGQSAAETQELERRLRKTAQRGVVKLFNAVRAAQVKGEEAEREAKMKGVVGIGKREERVNEMSKKGFLDLISQGGKKVVET
ncbi:Rrp15p-domain-containing protein [Rhizodiscina lignyota]|uniref:Rrp15p-domain-containing protein n=1 Tax=Rhizodiscina lignyota TaxID=1504668 RepID=A0A9P4M2M4_9PEZI|nr:Rrp15p-domain-containing protein [Rhizodiscina lignyota]